MNFCQIELACLVCLSVCLSKHERFYWEALSNACGKASAIQLRASFLGGDAADLGQRSLLFAALELLAAAAAAK